MIGGDSAYGMVEPFSPEEPRGYRRARTPSRGRARGFSDSPDRCGLWHDLRGDYRARQGGEGVGQDGIEEEIPNFAPAAKYEGNPYQLQGARLICLMKGRQTHFMAESLLQRTRDGDEVLICAYSFDHPIVIDKVVEAVRRGVRVTLCMEGKYLIGDQMSKTGTRHLISALDDINRALPRGRGRLRIFQVGGRRCQGAYSRYGRRVSDDYMGALHAKVLYSYPYLIMGSTNWSISSEANKELSVLAKVEDDETREYVEAELDELQHGKRECYRADLARALEGSQTTRSTGSWTTRPRGHVAG